MASINKLFEDLKNRAPKATNLSAPQLSDLLREIKKLKSLILLSLISNLSAAFDDIDGDDPLFGSIPLKERVKNATNPKTEEPMEKVSKDLLDQLEKVATTRLDMESKKRQFLLHRPTEQDEYGKSANPTPTSLPNQDIGSSPRIEDERTTSFVTHENTEWCVEFVTAEKLRNKADPVVSIWAPESDIIGVRGMEKNDGTWGELGANPHKQEIRVIIKPGTYEIYCEMKS